MESANKLVVIPLEELIALIEELLKKLFPIHSNSPYHSLTESNKRIMTRNEAAKFMGVTPNTITRWNRKGYIMGAVINGQYRFFESDLLKQINRKKS